MTAEEQVSSGRIRPGALLQQARDHAGMSLEAISEETRITLPRLEALERNDYKGAGSSATFIVGYIRAYAKAVGAPAGPIIKAFEADYSPAIEETSTIETVYVPMEAGKRNSGVLKKVAIVIFALALIILIISFFSGGEKSEDASSQLQVPQPAQVEEIPAINTGRDVEINRRPLAAAFTQSNDDETATGESQESRPRISSGVSTLELEEDAKNDALAATAIRIPDTSDIVVEEAENTVESQQKRIAEISRSEPRQATVERERDAAQNAVASARDAVAKDAIMMNFSAECWVEVFDATGKRIVTRLAQAGDTISARGTAPFDLKLGDAEAAVVQINGRFINTEPAIGRKIFRKKVGP